MMGRSQVRRGLTPIKEKAPAIHSYLRHLRGMISEKRYRFWMPYLGSKIVSTMVNELYGRIFEVSHQKIERIDSYYECSELVRPPGGSMPRTGIVNIPGHHGHRYAVLLHKKCVATQYITVFRSYHGGELLLSTLKVTISNNQYSLRFSAPLHSRYESPHVNEYNFIQVLCGLLSWTETKIIYDIIANEFMTLSRDFERWVGEKSINTSARGQFFRKMLHAMMERWTRVSTIPTQYHGLYPGIDETQDGVE